MSYDSRTLRLLLVTILLATVGCQTAQLSRHRPDTVFGAPDAEVTADAAPSTEQKAQVKLAMARTLERGGKFQEALHAYGAVAEQHPELRAAAHHRCAVICDQLEQTARADQFYGQALSAGAPSAELLCDRGYSYFLRGQLDEAREHLHRALHLHPNDARAHNNLALVCASSGRHEQAVREMVLGGAHPLDARESLDQLVTLERRRPQPAPSSPAPASHPLSPAATALAAAARTPAPAPASSTTTAPTTTAPAPARAIAAAPVAVGAPASVATPTLATPVGASAQVASSAPAPTPAATPPKLVAAPAPMPVRRPSAVPSASQRAKQRLPAPTDAAVQVVVESTAGNDARDSQSQRDLVAADGEQAASASASLIPGTVTEERQPMDVPRAISTVAAMSPVLIPVVAPPQPAARRSAAPAKSTLSAASRRAAPASPTQSPGAATWTTVNGKSNVLRWTVSSPTSTSSEAPMRIHAGSTSPSLLKEIPSISYSVWDGSLAAEFSEDKEGDSELTKLIPSHLRPGDSSAAGALSRTSLERSETLGDRYR